MSPFRACLSIAAVVGLCAAIIGGFGAMFVAFVATLTLTCSALVAWLVVRPALKP